MICHEIEEIAFLEWAMEQEKHEQDLFEMEMYDYMDTVFQKELEASLDTLNALP